MTPQIDLPIRYFESSAMIAVFRARTQRLELLTPEALRVVELWPGTSTVAISCFDYVRSTIGAYGEVGIAWPVVPRAEARFTPPAVPLLFEGRWPGLGWWVQHLPVTTEIARYGGRTLWGYPKLIGSIEYSWRGATRVCSLAEDGQKILELAVDTRMPAFPRKLALRTWSVLDSELLETVIDVDAVGLQRRFRGRAELTLGAHRMGRELAELGMSLSRPVEVRWFPVWRAELPVARRRIPLGQSKDEPAVREVA